METPEYLTPAEVAAICRVTRRTVYDWIKHAALPCVKLGRGWRIDRREVERFLASAPTNMRDPADGPPIE